jgi:hypothetical protein
MAITVDHIRGKTGGLWRRMAVGAVVYALVLQGFLFGLAGGQLVANTAADQDSPGFELCLHDGDSTPSAPAPIPGDHVHCIFCIVGSHHAFVTPSVSPPGMAVAADGIALPPAGDWRRPAPTHQPSAQPRGPPLTA